MKLLRVLRSTLLRRLVVAGMLAVLASVIVGLAAFLVIASRMQPTFHPIHVAIPLQRQAIIDSFPHYRRSEESTYLSFPEWYLVFNPQEYAESLRDRPPSQFPYFRSIRQFWRGYAQVYGITKYHYPFNFGNHLMLTVIGTSSTVEYLVKGVYENTVGRLSEWAGGGALTAEDAYAAKVAKDYGDFIPTRPWFEFPFGHAFTGLWSTTDIFGPHFLRKCERKFFLSVEYGVKFLYAGVIRLASHSVYGVADPEVYATVENLPESALTNAQLRKVRQLGENMWIITLPHYQGFTDTVPGLALQGIQFDEIAGNDEILVTVIAPVAWKWDLPEGHVLFTMDRLNRSATKRIALQVPVKSLGNLLREVEHKHLKVEHIFDY